MKSKATSEAGTVEGAGIYGKVDVIVAGAKGKSPRKWTVGSDDVAYPVVPIDEPVFEDGHLARNFFVDAASEIADECIEALKM